MISLASVWTNDALGLIEDMQDTSVVGSFRLHRNWFGFQTFESDTAVPKNGLSSIRKDLLWLLLKGNSNRTKLRRIPSSATELAARDGKIVRSIEYKNANIFNPSLYEKNAVGETRLQNLLTSVHINTRRRALSQQLIIKKDEPLDVFQVEDNERILRELPYIHDARFQVRDIPGSPDSVDLILVTQDLFPLGFEAELGGSKSGTASLWNQNIFGHGIHTGASLFWNTDHKPTIGYGLVCSMPSFSGRFFSGRIEHINRWNLNSLLIDFARDFRTADFKYAGGIMAERANAFKEIALIDTILYQNVNYSNFDLWGGRLFQQKSHSPLVRSGIFITGRVNQFLRHNQILPEEQYMQPFQEKMMVLFSGGFAKRGFIKDNLIYTFGRTEDVPFGYKFEATTGIEKGPMNTRTYFAISGAFGKYANGFGYFYSQLRYGTFIRSGHSEQGVFQFQTRYFTRLYQYRRFQYRNFINVSFVKGIRRFEGEFTSIENRSGISGLSGFPLRGNNKLTVNLESVMFSPYRLLGFRLAFFGAVDVGLVSPFKIMYDAKVFSGFRVGVRVRNEQMVFNTFEISFTWFPEMLQGTEQDAFNLGSLTRMRFNDFFPGKPLVVPYE